MIKSNILSIRSLLPIISEAKLDKGSTFVGIDFGTSTTVVSIASQVNGEKKIKTLHLKIYQNLY